jgi:hypothetical protein
MGNCVWFNLYPNRITVQKDVQIECLWKAGDDQDRVLNSIIAFPVLVCEDASTRP